MKPGEILGLVGESGCGKTTAGRVVLGLMPPTGGEVRFEDTDIFSLSRERLRQARRHMQIIFQDPYASLDPRMPVGESIAEGLKIHSIGSSRERFERAIEMLVGLADLPRVGDLCSILSRAVPAAARWWKERVERRP